MRALAYQGPGKLKVVKKPDPRIEHPQDVILRVTRAAICGSDLHLLHGPVPETRVGCTFGHEFTGVVDELGRDVKTFFCERGLFANCENTNPSSNDIASGVFGYSHSTGGFEGGQAEYVRVPFADVDRFALHRAPEAYRLFETRSQGCIECVLLPGGDA